MTIVFPSCVRIKKARLIHYERIIGGGLHAPKSDNQCMQPRLIH